MGIKDFKVRKQIARIMENIMTDASPKQLKIFLEKNVFEYFGKLIEEKDDFLQDIGLTGIRRILELEGNQADGDGSKACYGALLKKNKTREVIEKLQNHAKRISKLTTEILDFVDSAAEEGKA